MVPSVERGECFNVGVVLFCRQRGFLGARIELDEARLRALAPELVTGDVGPHLEALGRVAEGRAEAGRSPSCPSQSALAGWPHPRARSCRPPRCTLAGLIDELAAGPEVG